MDYDQIAHKMILHRIMDAYQSSRRKLVDIIADHTFGMTRDELEIFLKGTLAPALEEAWKREEASEQTIAEQARAIEEERKAREKAEREVASKDKEIEVLKRALEDAKNTKATDNRNRFGKSSRKTRHSVDKDFNRTERDQEKESFDGSDKGKDSEATSAVVKTAGEGKKIITERELLAQQARNGSHYKLSDASEKVVYPSERTGFPDGWIPVEGEETVTRVLYDTKKTIIARVLEFVKVRRLVKYTLEEGTEGERWEYDSIHVPCDGETFREDIGLETAEGNEKKQPFNINNIPGRIPGTSVTPNFAADMLVDTNLGFMSLNRIWNVMKEYGFKVSRQSIVNWNHAFGDVLKGAYEGIKSVVLCDGAVLFCDETWFRLHLNQLTRKVYEWIFANKKENAVFYHYDDGSRGRKAITPLLEGKNIKAIHTDGYNAYFFLEGIGILHITCAAHVWRYIMDWYNATKDENAGQLLTEIAALYTIESEIRGKSPGEILERRKSKEVTDILTRYKALLDNLELKMDKLTDIGLKAVRYALSQYSKMSRWREDPDFEIDNNFAERSARPAALQRKNSLFHASHRGAEASCIIRSVVETCRLWGRSVRDYLVNYFAGVVSGRTDYENMMPWSNAPC